MSDITYDPPQPNAALVVGPHDVLVIALPGSTTWDQFERFSDHIKDRCPGLADRAFVVSGAEQIAVVRPFVSELREGICGQELPSLTPGALAGVCELTHGHGSSWHETSNPDGSPCRWRDRATDQVGRAPGGAS